MIKKCYRLISEKGFMEEQGCSTEQINSLWDVDEDYTTKRDYIKSAKRYTEEFNKKFDTSFKYQELFGEPEDIGYRYCTLCEETFWADDGEHECEEW